MKQTRIARRGRRFLGVPLAAAGLLAGCASPLIDSAAVPVGTAPPPSPTVANLEGEPSATSPDPSGYESVADPSDPGSVAIAFVMVVSNRRRNDNLGEWRERAARFATKPVVETLTDSSRANVLGAGIIEAEGNATATIAGSALGRCGSERCRVLVVANQSVLIGGHPLHERNFVTWTLDLVESDEIGWLVVAVTYGAGS